MFLVVGLDHPPNLSGVLELIIIIQEAIPKSEVCDDFLDEFLSKGLIIRISLVELFEEISAENGVELGRSFLSLVDFDELVKEFCGQGGVKFVDAAVIF